MRRSWVILVALCLPLGLWWESALAIPPFARKYATSCTTCHYAFPKLNGFGKAFKNNGYRYPGDDERFVKEEPVRLGADAYKKVFPNAIWPSDIPGKVPVGVWLVGQASHFPNAASEGGIPGGDGSPVPAIDGPLTVGAAPAPAGAKLERNTIAETSFDTPAGVEFLFGGTLGETLSFFGSGEFASDGTASANFRVGYNPWTFLNVTFGMVDPDFTDNDPDRLTVQPYNVTRLSTESGFNLNDHQAGLEVWGAMDGLGGRGGLEYAVGVVNGNPGEFTDNNSEKDVYGRVSYKLFGHPVVGGGAEETSTTAEPWRDDQVKVTAFAYRGTGNVDVLDADGNVADVTQDRFLELGAKLAVWYDRFQLSAAYATLSDKLDRDVRSFRASAWYAEGDYVVYPWLIPAVRFESADLAHGIARDEAGNSPKETNIVGGVTFVPRANVKLVAEYFRGLDSFRSKVDAAFVQVNLAL
jgi:hypothetical protein